MIGATTGLPYIRAHLIDSQGNGVVLGGSAASSPSAAGSYVQMTSLASSVALTSIPTDAISALCIPDGQGVRWRADGTAPTASIGMPVPVGAFVTLYGAEMAAARFIQQAASATLNVYYSK